MNPLPRPSRNRPALLLALLAAGSLSAALTPTEWQHRQALSITTPGLTQVSLTADTLDKAQPDLSDLRLIDPSQSEIAFLLDHGVTSAHFKAPRILSPLALHSVPGRDSTQVLIETGTTAELDFLHLETSSPFFLKAAHGEISADGLEWQSLGPAIPLFRQFGAEQLSLALGRNKAAFIRVTLDDSPSSPVVFSKARLQSSPVQVAPPLPQFGARITRRDEFAGETVMTVLLDGRHAPLASLSFETDEPMFMRRVTVAIREMQGNISGESTVASGTIYRLKIEGERVREQLYVPLNFAPHTRELLVHIHNADSPPIAIGGVVAWQYPINLLFNASSKGSYTLLSGNAQAAAPRYDLAAFASEMTKANATTIITGALEDMPNYRPRDSLAAAPLPDVPLAGAPLDASDWTVRRALSLTRAGVQELELDAAALAGARADFADLRLLRGGNQIPYVLEQPALARSLALTAVAVPDPKRPTVSIWEVRLPQAGLPLRRLVLTSATPLFQREFRLYEKVIGPDGRVIVNTLTTGPWSRQPDPGVPETKTFELWGRPRTDTVLIETDNGDNPAIALGTVQVVYPVVRLVFKTADTDGFTLAYGNPAANAPRYDLSLVTVKLLTASRNGAQLEPAVPGTPGRRLGGLNGGYIFWGALALVVVVLLTVVAKLLPKPPATGQ